MSYNYSKILLLLFFSLFNISYQSQDNSKEFSLIINKDKLKISADDIENMRILQDNKIYIKSQIAIPNQNLKLYLKFSEYITYITDGNYKKGDSSSYEFIRTKNDGKTPEFTPLNFQTDNLKSGYESKEIIKLGENIIYDFNFILADKLNNNYEIDDSIVGLNLPEINIRPVLMNTNIFEQLKKNNLIYKRIFSIFFNTKVCEGNNNENNNEEGQIIFGKLPHELYDNKKYDELLKKYNINEKTFNWINAEVDQYHIKWKLKLDDIICVNEHTSDLIAELVIEQTFFTGTQEFKKIMQKYFFDGFISKKLCKEEKFFNYKDNYNYYFYNCDNSIKSYFDKYNTNILEFKSKDLNTIFSFQLKELFLEYNNRLYFGIIFDEYQIYGWKLGRLFFEKYPLIFSIDNKAIGYYNQNENIINVNTNSNKNTMIVLIVLVVVLLIIILIGFRKYNVLKSLIPRKLMANELYDQYTYSHVEDNKKEITTEMTSKINSNSVSSLGY